MYNTGEAYRQAIQADVRDFRIKGTLTSREGDVVEFDDTDVVSGSYTHNASSQPGDLFQHGGVVAKDMSIKILDRDYIIDNLTGDEWGRNLILDSDNLETISSNSNVLSSAYTDPRYGKVLKTETKVPGEFSYFTVFYDRLSEQPQIGSTATLSMLIKGEVFKGEPNSLKVYYNDNTNTKDIENISSDYAYLSVTFDVNSKTSRFHIYPNSFKELHIARAKLEKGSTPTPWTPAPEDLKWSDKKLDFSGGTISVQIGLKLEDENYSWVPMGKFLIDDFSQKDEVMSIRAMDEMVRLDESYNNSNITYPTTLKQIYINICADMDITPRTTSFLNDTIRVSKKPEDATYRQVLQAVAELSGTFAQMHRNGGLELKWYEDQSQYEITPNERFAFNQDDFIASIPGISYEIKEENEDGEQGSVISNLFGQEEGALDLSDNILLPFIENKDEVVQAVYDKVSGFEFIPYDTTFVGDPSLDVGDVITQITTKDSVFLTPITGLTFTFRGNQEIEGKGLDYRVNKFQGSISSAIKQIVKDQNLTLDEINDMEQSVRDLTDLIVNTMGGFLTTTDGEIYIHDMPSLDDSMHVWKWGLGGFGYSETGKDGIYTTGMDANGTLVARLISAGIVSADAIKTGILMTQDGKSYIDLDNGYFNLNDKIIFDENGFRMIVSSGKTIEQELQDIDDVSTELSIEMDNIRAGIQVGGGNNLIKNSVGYGDLNYWNVINDDDYTLGNSTWILQGVSNHGFIFSNFEIEQDLKLEPNKEYTISGKLQKNTPAGIINISLNDNQGLVHEVINLTTETYEGQFSLEFNSGENSDLILNIKGLDLSTAEPSQLTDLFLVQGKNNEVWSQANGEVYTLNVKVDGEGIRVYGVEGKGYTVMSPEEFAGYYNNKQVFTVNKDITEVMGLLVKEQGLFIPPVKMVQNGNVSLDIVWTGGI